jgi:hypothetical protein
VKAEDQLLGAELYQNVKNVMAHKGIQDFLNLPGLVGAALIDAHARAYFCGVQPGFDAQQRESLVRSIFQVVETMPEEFEAFKFQFSNYLVYVYKLKSELVLMALIQPESATAEYAAAIQRLQTVLAPSASDAINLFEQASLSCPLLSQPAPQPTVAVAAPPPVVGLATATAAPPEATQSTTAPAQRSRSRLTSLAQVVTALNQLSQFTTHYLGTQVIVNYWKATRPSHDWLNQFQIDRGAQFQILDATPDKLRQTLSPQQQVWLQEWVAAFITRCSQVIRDFPVILQQKALNDEQKALLLGIEGNKPSKEQ